MTGTAALARVAGVLFLGILFPALGQEIWRGNFIAGKQGLMMSPCRSGERIAVEDATPQHELESVYRELAQKAGRAIFIEVAGRREGAALRAERLHRAYAEGPGCREDLEAVRLRALGNEPFWNLDARADGVLLRRLGQRDEHRFPAGAFERRGAEYRYEGAARNSVLHLSVREERCRDTMSNALYTLRASVDWNGQRFTGCAYWGELERR